MTSFELFDDHQRRAIALLDEVIAALQPGMKARDVVALATDKRAAHGFDRWFQAPDVVISGGSITTGALVTIDLAPATDRAFGDIGVTFAYKAPEPEIVTKAREVVRATAGYASPHKVAGELFVYAKAWANNRQCHLVAQTAGHACLENECPFSWAWPTSARVAMRLRRHQLRMLNPNRARGVWALRLPISDGTHTAVFEEMIAISDSERRVLGRPGVEDIGAWPSLGVKPIPPIGLKGDLQTAPAASAPDDDDHDHDHGHGHDHDHR
jgi:hypothetical protein